MILCEITMLNDFSFFALTYFVLNSRFLHIFEDSSRLLNGAFTPSVLHGVIRGRLGHLSNKKYFYSTLTTILCRVICGTSVNANKII